MSKIKYKCSMCGASGCKLWRQYQTFADQIKLMCAYCAAKTEETDISALDEKGNRPSKYGGTTEQIGSLVPAVPTEDNSTYWGYTSIPPKGVEWWRNLPTFPKETVHAVD